MRHWLAHLFGWNTGIIEGFYVVGVLYVGFKCGTCGEINHALPFDYGALGPGTESRGE